MKVSDNNVDADADADADADIANREAFRAARRQLSDQKRSLLPANGVMHVTLVSQTNGNDRSLYCNLVEKWSL